MLRKIVLAAMLATATVPGPAFAQTAEKNILMVLWRGITEPEVAFKDKLAAMGFKAKFTEVVGDQDRAILADRVRAIEPDIEAKKFDVIYSFGTTTTQVTELVVKDRIPIVFNIVFDPVGGKLVRSMTEPGNNATGVTNGVPMDDQLNAFHKLAPMKSLAVLFNAREPNSNIIERQVAAWAAKAGVSLTSVRVAPTDESINAALEDFKAGKYPVEAVYAGADSFLGSKADVIQAAIGEKYRLLGGTQTFVLRGWLAAYTPLVTDMGATAAEMVVKVANGADARKMAVVLPQPKMIMSKSAAAKHKVALPADAVLEN